MVTELGHGSEQGSHQRTRGRWGGGCLVLGCLIAYPYLARRGGPSLEVAADPRRFPCLFPRGGHSGAGASGTGTHAGRSSSPGEVTVAMAPGSDARPHVTRGCHGAGRPAAREPRLPE